MGHKRKSSGSSSNGNGSVLLPTKVAIPPVSWPPATVGKEGASRGASAFRHVREYLLERMARGTTTLVAIQRCEHPIITAIAKTASFFGAETFYVTVVAILLLATDWRFGFLWSLLLALSLTTGNVLKNIFMLPRPQSPPVKVLDREHDWGMPSTHAVNSICLGGYAFVYLAEHYDLSQSFLVAWFAGTLIWAALVIGSRLYLGVHSPIDVAVGAPVGLVLLLVWTVCDDWLADWMSSDPWAGMQGSALCILIILLHPRPFPTTSYFTSVVILGMANGLFVEAFLLQHPDIWPYARLEYNAIWLNIGLRLLIGPPLVFLMKVLQKTIYYPALDYLCTRLNVSHVKHVASTIESQPSFTHAGILEKLFEHHRRVHMQKLLFSRQDPLPMDPTIADQEVNIELIFNRRSYLIHADVVVKFLVYSGMSLSVIPIHALYRYIGI